MILCSKSKIQSLIKGAYIKSEYCNCKQSLLMVAKYYWPIFSNSLKLHVFKFIFSLKLSSRQNAVTISITKLKVNIKNF